MPSTETTLTIDARGLSCPMPLLKAKQALSKLDVGQTLLLIASDPASQRDVKAYASLSCHSLVSFSAQAGDYKFILQKGRT